MKAGWERTKRWIGWVSCWLLGIAALIMAVNGVVTGSVASLFRRTGPVVFSESPVAAGLLIAFWAAFGGFLLWVAWRDTREVVGKTDRAFARTTGAHDDASTAGRRRRVASSRVAVAVRTYASPRAIVAIPLAGMGVYVMIAGGMLAGSGGIATLLGVVLGIAGLLMALRAVQFGLAKHDPKTIDWVAWMWTAVVVVVGAVNAAIWLAP